MPGRLQNEDIKSVAELAAQGCGPEKLPNDDKIYITANGINKTLKEAIEDNDIGGGGASGGQSGQADIADGDTFVDITITSITGDYFPVVQWVNLVDASPDVQEPMVTQKAPTVFRVSWNAPALGNNNKIAWEVGKSMVQIAVVALGNGVDSVNIPIPIEWQNLNFAPIVKIENTTDTDPGFYSTIVTAKSTTQITAKLNATTDSVNYKAVLYASAHTA